MSVPSAYLGVILVWSTTPLAIQWSSGDLSFQFGLAARMIIGLLTLLVIMRISGTRLELKRHAWPIYLIAGLALYMAMSLVYWASEYIPSGWISVIFGLTPVVSSLAHRAFNPQSPVNRYEILGAVMGFAGLSVIFYDSFDIQALAGLGVILMLASVTVHSVSAVWVKHRGERLHAPLSGMTITSGSLIVSIPLFVLNWALADGALPSTLPLRDISAIVYLGIFGSAIGFSLYFYLLKHITVRAVALITLLTPVIALWLGVQLNHEHISLATVAGTAIILSSLLVSQWGSRSTQR